MKDLSKIKQLTQNHLEIHSLADSVSEEVVSVQGIVEMWIILFRSSCSSFSVLPPNQNLLIYHSRPGFCLHLLCQSP